VTDRGNVLPHEPQMYQTREPNVKQINVVDVGVGPYAANDNNQESI
jgi:hypothetical protein